MTQPFTLNEFKSLAKKARRVALSREIPAGQLTPVSIYRLLHQRYKTEGVILEDLQQGKSTRYAFICFETMESLQINKGGQTCPLTALREKQSQRSFATRPELAERITHSVGFITYDLIRAFETLPDRHLSDPLLPVICFHFYAVNLTFDYTKKTILISIIVEVDDQPEQDYHFTQQKIIEIVQLLLSPPSEERVANAQNETSSINVDISEGDFVDRIEKAKDYIRRGDAFQIVLSRCFTRDYTVSPLDIYNTLRQISPAPFMFYFPTEAGVFLGASPERLIGVHNQQVTVNPIAGTRKATQENNHEAISADLLQDEKELAEHMMLVDLARNDVGVVSEPRSVQVSELLHVKHYSHTSHITSTVIGQLKKQYDALDAFKAAFPAGTLSGAPKIRAMQIIDELETSHRGLYGGAICRFDALGNFESCIAIRMAMLKDGIATIRTGAGIVYNSNPAAEAQETHQKAQAILDAIAQAHGEVLCC